MLEIFDSTHTYYAGQFKCINCNHETIVFIDSDYSMFNIMEVDKVCSCCSLVKECLSDGDLILRYDWPDPDYPHWQLQSASLKDEDRYCWNCKNKVKQDWRKLIVACSQCDGTMEYLECFT